MTLIEQAIEALTRCTPYMYKSAPIDKYVAHYTVIAELRAQPAEINFCSRCGKRAGDYIHTCTPPIDALEGI